MSKIVHTINATVARIAADLRLKILTPYRWYECEVAWF
jgi:hypothetical protein